MLLCLFAITTFLVSTEQSNVLGLFPHFGYSHFKVFHPILLGLAERGHNVTVVSYIKNPTPHINYRELLITGKNTKNNFNLKQFSASRSVWQLLREYLALHTEGQDSCKRFYESGQVEKILHQHAETPYDLVITEFFNTDCYLGIPYLLQVSVVGLSSCALMPWYYDRILLPDSPSFVQSEFVGFPEELNWRQRLLNFIQMKANKILYKYHTNRKDNEVIRKYLHVDMDVHEFAKISTSLVFVNQHYSLSGSSPRTPQLIEMGGVHVNAAEENAPLPDRIERFLQDSPNGVLFISWGSMLRSSTIDRELLQTIVEVLQDLPLKVVWKWEEDESPVASGNFLFTKWAPQLSLLCHDKVKVFWGHGGLLGVTEAVHCGKPMILTPIYGDQFLNAHAVVNRGVGVIMSYNQINHERLFNAIAEVRRPCYAARADALSLIFRTRNSPPLHVALWWIEHLLRHGPLASDLLRTKAVHLHWFVYHSLDSVALIVAAFLALVLLACSLNRATRSLRHRVHCTTSKAKRS